MREAGSRSDVPMVVLRSNDCCFLGIARSCAAAGHPIVPIVFDWAGSGPWYSERSNVVLAPLRIPNPYREPERALEAMIEIGRRLLEEWHERLMIVPSSDTNLMFLLDHFDSLSQYFRLSGDANFEAARLDVVRKDSAAVLLEAGGVAVPRTLACLKAGDAESVAREIPYPCVYKPAIKDYGQTFYATHGGRKAVECTEPDELTERLIEETRAGFELVVQEKIAFSSMSEEIPFYLYADRDHRIRMAATGIKEKIQPPPFGTATVLRLAWHEELLPLAQTVVDALSWRGILMIEFIRDLRDGRWKVIEVNARPWLCVDFYRRCGLNFLDMLYLDWRSELPPGRDVIRPDPSVLERSPVNISLPAAASPDLDRLGRPVEISDVVAWLLEIEGSRSLTFLDPNDPLPGRAELRSLAERYSLAPEELIARIEEKLGGE